MDVSDEVRVTPRIKMKKKSSNMDPGLSIGAKATRGVGRPKKRWEDDINQFLKPEEIEETRGNNLKSNDTWVRAAKDQKWKENGEGPRQKIANPANTIQTTTTTTYSIDGNDRPVYSQYTQEYAEDEGYSQYTQEYAEEGEIDSGYSTRS